MKRSKIILSLLVWILEANFTLNTAEIVIGSSGVLRNQLGKNVEAFTAGTEISKSYAAEKSSVVSA